MKLVCRNLLHLYTLILDYKKNEENLISNCIKKNT